MDTAATTQVITVEVEGGALEAEVVTADTAPVLAVHGLSSNRKLWNWLRAEDPGLSLIAPDLRGRAGSVGVTGPSSIARHVADLLAVLDDRGLDAVHVCGMSMGAFVAVELATTAPERVRSLTLVDGGLPMARPEGFTRDLVPAAFASQADRGDHAFAGVDDYRAHFLAGAPLLDVGDPFLRDNLVHDLGPDGRVRLVKDAVLADAEDVFFGDMHWESLDVPTRLLAAEWSTGVDTPPAYSDDAVAGFRERLPCLVDVRRVPGVDHAASIMTRRGAAVVAELIRAAL